MTAKPSPAQRIDFMATTGAALLARGYDLTSIMHGLKHPGRDGWQADRVGLRHDAARAERGDMASAVQVERWAADRRVTGVGVMCNTVLAIDIDVLDDLMADQLARLVEARLGVSVRRIGRAPKLLLVYRCDSPIRRSRSTRYRDPTNRLYRPDGKEQFHGIDFWGEGSQFVAYGWHPETGRPYYYEGAELVAVDRDDLPVITEADIRWISEQFDAVCLAAGWEAVDAATERGLSVVDTTRPAGPLAGLETAQPKYGATLDEVRGMLACVDPDLDGNDYDTVIKAVAFEFGDTAEAGAALELLKDWASQGAKWSDAGSGFKQLRTRWERARRGSPAGVQPVRLATVQEWVAKGRNVLPGSESPTDGFGAVEAPVGRQSADLRKGRAGDIFEVTDPWADPDWSYDVEAQPPPRFPFELFGEVGEIIQQAALGKGAPADYVASALMASASALLQNSREARIHAEWREPSVVWVVNVGRPSANKSPAMDAAIGALDALQGELNADFESKRVQFEMARRQAEIERAAWERKAKTEVENGRPAPPMTVGARAPSEPNAVVLYVSAGSVEKLITRKAGQSEGLLIVADELGGLLSTVSRPDQGHYRAALVAAYGARPFSYDLVKHGQQALRVERFALSIAGNIQPGKLAEVLETADDGLVARFDFIAPPAAPVEAYRGEETGSVFTEALRSLLCLPGGGTVELLDLTRGAREIAEECRQRVRELEVDQSELVQGWIGKAPGKVVRYALIFAHLDYAFGHASLPTEIDAEHAERGRAYVFDYLLPMMQRALGQASVSLGEKRARALFDLIRDKYRPGQQFAVRDLQQHNRHDLREADDIRLALATLAEGEIVRRERPIAGAGRAERWAANPAIWRDGSGIL
jgi:hypothetical protein